MSEAIHGNAKSERVNIGADAAVPHVTPDANPLSSISSTSFLAGAGNGSMFGKTHKKNALLVKQYQHPQNRVGTGARWDSPHRRD